MNARHATRFAAGLGVLLMLAGCPKDFFVCGQDSECTEEANGRCEPSGSCSFPDTQCPTGRRYGDQGNPQVAGRCVEPGDLGSSGQVTADAGTAGGTTDLTNAGDGTTNEATTANATTDDGSTSLPVTGAQTSSGGIGSDGSSSSGASSSSTGEPIPVRELFQPCTMDTQDVDCPETRCIELSGGISGAFCAQYCFDAEECYDPGTGASMACIVTSANGTQGGSCMLDCTDTGADGCPAGMSCSALVGFLDGNQLRVCLHPL